MIEHDIIDDDQLLQNFSKVFIIRPVEYGNKYK